MRFNAVIFDLDDTIHDKSSTLRAVASRLYADHALSRAGVDLEKWNSMFLILNHQRIEKATVFAELKKAFAINESVTRSLLADYDSNLGSQARPYAGALECMMACKVAGMKIGLITNGRDQFQRSKIVGMGASPYIDAIFTSGAFGTKKPDPAIFEACLKALGVQASETAVVGDDLGCDIEPAILLGMTPIWKSSNTAPKVALSTHDFQEIQAYLTTPV